MLQPKAGYIDARPLTARSTKTLATHGRTIHLGQVAHGMLTCSQFVDEHLAVRLLKTAVMACRSDRAVDLIICLDNRSGIPASNCSAKGRETCPDRDEIAVGPTNRRKVPNNRLEHVHRLIVIDDIDELECRNPGTAIWLKLDQPFRCETN